MFKLSSRLISATAPLSSRMSGRSSFRSQRFAAAPRPAFALAAPVVYAPARSLWRVPADAKGIDNEYQHSKGKTLEETLYADKGLIRWGFGELQGGFGTQKNPVIVVSALPERVVGCVGDGGEFEHPLMFFNAQTNGPKYMCSGCGQFFQVKDTDPSVSKADLETVAEIEKAVEQANHGVVPKH